MEEFKEARQVAFQSLETFEAQNPADEILWDLHRLIALADAKLGNFEQAYQRIESAKEDLLAKKVGGVVLAMFYETAARIAICGKDIDRFIINAKAVADIYGPGKNPTLIAKYAQLMMDAERAQLPGQWRVQSPLETDFLSTKTATNMLQLVHATMSECTAIEQSYQKALELLIQLTEATNGYIYAIAKEGLTLMAPMQRDTVPARLDSELRDFLDRWRARRAGQQPETQTLASRTLTRARIVERSTIITNDYDSLQPLVLWIENEEQTEVVCVAALAVPELPLEDLLWPFTSVIAHYLPELNR